MNTKELIAACRDTADALGDANLRISTTKFDSRSVSDLLWAAAAALEAKCSCGKAGAGDQRRPHPGHDGRGAGGARKTGEIIRGNKADRRSQGMGRDVADDGIQLRTGGQ